MQGAGRRVQGVGCRVQGAGCRVQGAGLEHLGALALSLDHLFLLFEERRPHLFRFDFWALGFAFESGVSGLGFGFRVWVVGFRSRAERRPHLVSVSRLQGHLAQKKSPRPSTLQ